MLCRPTPPLLSYNHHIIIPKKKDKINIAIVGLEFGAEFIPIYQKHPLANMYAICQRNEDKLNEIGDAFGIAKRYTSYDDLLQDPEVNSRAY